MNTWLRGIFVFSGISVIVSETVPLQVVKRRTVNP
jgi:hypothetical protein